MRVLPSGAGGNGSGVDTAITVAERQLVRRTERIKSIETVLIQ